MFSGSILRGGYQRIVERKPYQDIFLNPKSVAVVGATEVLGNRIIAQGGTFRNPAVLRAFELLLEKDVIRPDIPELMGAYGAALTALGNHIVRPAESTGFNAIEDMGLRVDFTKRELHCNGCENNCPIMKLTFANGNRFFTGNRCERHFSNSSGTKQRGVNLIAEQIDLLIDRETEPKGDPILTFGIPRCLNMYENFPFWSAFLVQCGFRVVLSSRSDSKLFERGSATVMSENICFPAKLAHGHIFDLIDRGGGQDILPDRCSRKKRVHRGVEQF